MNSLPNTPAETSAANEANEAMADHEQALVHFAQGFVKRRAVAEEIVQDAFVRLQNQDGIQKPKAWLFRCVRNLCLNHLRDHQRESLGDPPPRLQLVDLGTPDEALQQAESIALVQQLVANLSPDDRRLLHLKYDKAQSYREITAELKISVGNVGYRLHHVLKHLADEMAHAGYPSQRFPSPPTK